MSSSETLFMPRVFDNIAASLLPALQETITLCDRADFCVGYFNLRGWRQLHDDVEKWPGGEGNCCRLLVGMQTLPADELRAALTMSTTPNRMDNATALRLKRNLAEDFRDQLCVGVPTDDDETGLRRLAQQIKAKKVVVKLFVKHPLHAKLYLLFRPDPINPITGFLGSSNLTLAGLSRQGELNVDVLDHDATNKLAKWFQDRWDDHWCLDISKELVEIIETSWARETPIPPYHIYLKIAYCLSQEARAGLSEFRIPKEFGNHLFDFQKAAVKIAAYHLNKRGGVMIGDVVGLGKTLMATAVARIFEDDHGIETLIICPKNLVRMWEDYRDQYRLHAKVMSVTRVIAELQDCRRYRLVLIDESHNLRNREGKRYHAIRDYIEKNESRVVLLSATPYNKSYLDLASQLRLFVAEDRDLGIRPERLLQDIGEAIWPHQCPVRSLAAFEHSPHPDDWRELMRLYLVRRTRSFIQDNYAQYDPTRDQKYLTFEDGRRSYFPIRVPKTLKFRVTEDDTTDQYGRLYCEDVVKTINKLDLPRYGLGNYVAPAHQAPRTQQEDKHIDDLSRAGKRLMGFCRTGLFKRLESSGAVFLQSLERHILRNYVYLHAIENNLPIPIGTQDVEMLDSRVNDEDADDENARLNSEEETAEKTAKAHLQPLRTPDQFRAKAKEIYEFYEQHAKRRFKWLRHDLFISELSDDLQSDAKSLIKILKSAGQWEPAADTKLQTLLATLKKDHPDEKVLIFTQFADTARYLERQLAAAHVARVASATGDSSDPTLIAWNFSPASNGKRANVAPLDELRVLVATDVLSEGQNLQDCHVVINYDLPWAIIRLIQRAGRVDRIGQEADTILCYSFLPAEGVNKIIKLRERVRQRLKENQEVVGADEFFFEDQRDEAKALNDLYTEKAGILDGEADNEVDLSSYAYQIWKNAVDADPELEKLVPGLPPVVYSSRPWTPSPDKPEGALVYLKTADGNDALAWMDLAGQSVTESQYAILRAAECKPDTPCVPRHANHHQLVADGVKLIVKEDRAIGGQLGRPSGARFRTYERLKAHAEDIKGTLFESPVLYKTIEQIYRYPLRQTATDTLNRQLRSAVSNHALAELVVSLYEEDRLCIVHEEQDSQEPRIICSMGLVTPKTLEPPK
jgi:superfamily II DNA or RNA helicase